MKCALTVVLLLAFELAKCQSLPHVDSVDYYISRLDWDSFVVGSTYVPQIGLKEDAKRLIEIRDKAKIKKLISSIGTDQKTVVIHMILSRLLDSAKEQFGESYIYGKDASVKGVIYSYNGLKWARDSLQNDSISLEEINKINRYWRKRCRL